MLVYLPRSFQASPSLVFMAVAVSSSCSLLRLAAFWPVDSSQWKRHPFVFFSNLPSDLVRTSLRVSRRSPSYPNEAVVAVPDPRVWRGNQDDEKDDHGENDSDDDEGEDRSLDLLVQFLHNMFRKISRRTRKAVRSVLPPSISTNLVCSHMDFLIHCSWMHMIRENYGFFFSFFFS